MTQPPHRTIGETYLLNGIKGIKWTGRSIEIYDPHRVRRLQDGKDKVITFLRHNHIRWRNIVAKAESIKLARLNIIIHDNIGPIPPGKRINIAAEATE